MVKTNLPMSLPWHLSPSLMMTNERTNERTNLWEVDDFIIFFITKQTRVIRISNFIKNFDSKGILFSIFVNVRQQCYMHFVGFIHHVTIFTIIITHKRKQQMLDMTRIRVEELCFWTKCVRVWFSCVSYHKTHTTRLTFFGKLDPSNQHNQQ